jgi:hypothetical protein
MIRNRFLRGLRFVLFAVLFLVVFGFVVMRLWNWLMPAVFGLQLINFWQAIGLLILSKIFFGGFRGRPSHHWYGRRRMMERWQQMTPEERAKFRETFRGRCGSFGRQAAEGMGGNKGPTGQQAL